MLKLLLWMLIVANGGLLAFRMGYLDTLFATKGEPLRMASQINADKIRLVAPPPATPTTPSPSATITATPPALTPSPAKPLKIVACTEIGDFATRDSRKIEARLTELALGDRQSRRVIQEVAPHMVFIPPQGGKEAAERKAAVASKVTGRLVSLHVEEGSKVKKGQVIARLELRSFPGCPCRRPTSPKSDGRADHLRLDSSSPSAQR